jgi:hypothetical protein
MKMDQQQPGIALSWQPRQAGIPRTSATSAFIATTAATPAKQPKTGETKDKT